MDKYDSDDEEAMHLRSWAKATWIAERSWQFCSESAKRKQNRVEERRAEPDAALDDASCCSPSTGLVKLFEMFASLDAASTHPPPRAHVHLHST